MGNGGYNLPLFIDVNVYESSRKINRLKFCDAYRDAATNNVVIIIIISCCCCILLKVAVISNNEYVSRVPSAAVLSASFNTVDHDRCDDGNLPNSLQLHSSPTLPHATHLPIASLTYGDNTFTRSAAHSARTRPRFPGLPVSVEDRGPVTAGYRQPPRQNPPPTKHPDH